MDGTWEAALIGKNLTESGVLDQRHGRRPGQLRQHALHPISYAVEATYHW